MCCRDNKLEGMVKELYRYGDASCDDFYRALAANLWDKTPEEVTDEEYNLVKTNFQDALGCK